MFGEEHFLLEEAYIHLKPRIADDPSTQYDFEVIDIEDLPADKIFDKIVDSCSAYPFIAKQRTIIVKHFEKLTSGRVTKKKQQNPTLLKYLKSPQTTTFLVIMSSDEKLNGTTVKKTKSLPPFPYDYIIDNYEFIEFQGMYESKYPDWIKSRCQKFGKTIAGDAVELLVSLTNPTLRDISNELDKLFLFIGNRNNITKQDVNSAVGASKVYNVFELQKAVGKRQLPESLLIIENMLANDRQEMLIITMLTRYFTALWKTIELASSAGSNTYQLAPKIGVNPYFVNEYLSAVKKYKPEEIDSAFTQLCQADEQLKSSSTDSVYILQKMLISIMDL